MTWFTFTLVCFAVYRLAVLITQDEGPFSVFTRWRVFVGAEGPGAQTTWVGRGFACPVCVSFWLALAASIWLDGGVLGWLAIAGGAVLILKVGRY